MVSAGQDIPRQVADLQLKNGKIQDTTTNIQISKVYTDTPWIV